jgi:hypothetical protein
MDERRRLLHRAFSREGAAEALEDHRDPTTGETVNMTPSQWALAEYDRLHPPAGAGRPRQLGGTRQDADADDPTDAPGSDSAVSETDRPLGAPAGRAQWSRRWRRGLPYLSAAAGLALGAGLAFGVQGMARPSPQAGSADAPTPAARQAGGEFAAGAGDGDEGDTLATVANYFADTAHSVGLPAAVTSGFDATSFHPVIRTALVQASSTIYAARRLDEEYCFVAVTTAGRAAESCGSLDVLARRGLWLTEDAVSAIDGHAVAVTVTWETDGTISWEAVPTVD